MYILERKYHRYKTDSILDLIGYEIKINRNKVYLYNQELIDLIIKDKFYPDYHKVVKQILIYLEDDDSDNEDATLYLEELFKYYDIYINKYEKYLSTKEKNRFMRELRSLTNELKKKSYKKTKKPETISKGRHK